MSADKEFEDFFRERLSGLEETPPENAWNTIRQDIVPKRRKYAWFPFVFLFCVISVSALFLARKTRLPETENSQPLNTTASAPGNVNSNPENERNTGFSASGSATENVSGKSPVERSGNDPENQPASQSGTAGDRLAHPEFQESGRTSDQSGKYAQNASGTSNAKPSLNTLPEVAARNSKRASSPAKRYVAARKNPASQPDMPLYRAKKQKTNQEPQDVRVVLVPANEAARQQTDARFARAEAAARQTNGLTEMALLTGRTASLPGYAYNVPEILLPTEVSDSVAALSAETEENYDSWYVVETSANWAFDVYAAPLYSLARRAANAGPGSVSSNIGSESSTAERLGYEAGAVLHRSLADRTSLDFGFGLTYLQDKVAYLHNQEPEQYQARMYYGTFRLGITQHLYQSEKNKLFVSPALGLNLLLRGESKKMEHGNWSETITHQQTTDPLNDFNTHFYLGAGYARQLSRSVALLAEPNFTWYFKSAYRTSVPVTVKPYTLGLNLGLRIAL